MRAKRQVAAAAVDQLLEKRLPGFGELSRMLSYPEIGSAAILSRATTGVYRGRFSQGKTVWSDVTRMY